MALRVLLVALLLLTATGCVARTAGSDDGVPADFAGEITYRNGTVAPPYHYEWRVEFGADTARLAWSPGYETAETWTETADLDADGRQSLYDRLRETGVFEFEDSGDEGLVGGPTGRATFDGVPGADDSGTLGTSAASQDLLDEVVAATRAVFPAGVWAEMERKQAEWGDGQ
jgi:hypothetical protein